jgi:hypothetical protein
MNVVLCMQLKLLLVLLSDAIDSVWNVMQLSSEDQETGAIPPAPENAHKQIWGAWSIAPVKKNKKTLNFFVENN